MTGEPVEHRAARMLAVYQRIAAKMYTLDAHAGRRFLRDGRLDGETAEVAARVNPGVDRLWARFNALRRLADRIPAHPQDVGTRARADVDELLSRESVGLDADGLPVAGSTDAVAEWLRPTDFAEEIETDCAGLLRQCTDVDTACGAVADTAAALTAQLEAATVLAASLGMARNPELAELRRLRADALERALADPLTAARGAHGHRLGAAVSGSAADGLAAVTERVDAFHRDLTERDATHRDLPRRLAELHDRLAVLTEAEAHAAEVGDLAARKILAPAPPRHTAVAEALAAELRDVARRVAESDRHGAAAQLADVSARLEAAERECRRITDTATALLDRRAELRGRLAAYSRKAARIGVVEQPRVAASARAAGEVLAVAPCDLRSATRAVHQFQQEISAAQEAPA